MGSTQTRRSASSVKPAGRLQEWNQLPSTNGGLNTLSGDSYDNTRRLDGIIGATSSSSSQFAEDRKAGDGC